MTPSELLLAISLALLSGFLGAFLGSIVQGMYGTSIAKAQIEGQRQATLLELRYHAVQGILGKMSLAGATISQIRNWEIEPEKVSLLKRLMGEITSNTGYLPRSSAATKAMQLFIEGFLDLNLQVWVLLHKEPPAKPKTFEERKAIDWRGTPDFASSYSRMLFGLRHLQAAVDADLAGLPVPTTPDFDTKADVSVPAFVGF